MTETGMAVKVAAVVALALCALCGSAMAQEGGADREIAELAAARHTGEQNGWEHVQRALAAVAGARREAEQAWEGSGQRGDGPSIRASELLSGSLPRDGLDEGLMYLDRARARGAFEALKAFAEIGQAWVPPQEVKEAGGVDEAMRRRMGHGGSVRELARLTAASMRLAAIEGDRDEQAALFDALLALGQTNADRLVLIDRLIGMALVNLAIAEARREALEGLVDEPTAIRMLRSIDARLPLAPLEASRRAEALQAVMMTEELGGDLAAEGEEAKVADKIVEASREGAGGDEDAAQQGAEGLAKFLAEMLDRSMDEVSGAERVMRMQSQGTRIVLALEVFKAREGAYPESLAALAPEILTEVPDDPLGEVAFGYRRLAEPDEHGRGYLLWSAGLDGEDNGTHPDGSHAAQRERGAGFDVVLNEPREEPWGE